MLRTFTIIYTCSHYIIVYPFMSVYNINLFLQVKQHGSLPCRLHSRQVLHRTIELRICISKKVFSPWSLTQRTCSFWGPKGLMNQESSTEDLQEYHLME